MFLAQSQFIDEPTMTGTVHEIIRQGQEWRIHVYGVSWAARSQIPVNLLPGDAVRVTGRERLTLLIEPL